MSHLLSSSSNPHPVERLREVINDALNKVKDDFTRNEQAAASVYPPIQKVTNCNPFGKRMTMSSYETHDLPRYGWGNKRTADQVEQYTKNLAAEWLAQAETTHAINLPAIESNKTLIAALKALMSSIKMPQSYSYSDYGPTGRARTKQHHTKQAGWMDDISREIVTSDGYEAALSDHKRFLADIDTYVKERRAKEVEEKRKADAEKAKLEKERLLGVYQGRYGLPTTASPCDVLDVVLAKDKYLRLAHYLSLNRASWVDGPSFAEQGLNGFSAQNDQDKAIHLCISGLIEDWCGDGRIFRDCEWNYDRIFGLVSENLMKEYREIVDWVGIDTLV